MLPLVKILRNLRLSVIALHLLRFLGSTSPRTLAPSGKHIVDHILLHIVTQYVPFHFTLLLYPIPADQTPILLVLRWPHHLGKTQIQEEKRGGPEPLPESAHRGLVDAQRPPYPCSRPMLSQRPENEPLLVGREPGTTVTGFPRRRSFAECLAQGRLWHEVLTRKFGLGRAFANCMKIVRIMSVKVKRMGRGHGAIVGTMARPGK